MPSGLDHLKYLQATRRSHRQDQREPAVLRVANGEQEAEQRKATEPLKGDRSMADRTALDRTDGDDEESGEQEPAKDTCGFGHPFGVAGQLDTSKASRLPSLLREAA